MSCRLLRLLLMSGVVCFGFSIAAGAERPIDPSVAKTSRNDSTQWYDLRNLDIEGKGWTKTKSFYDRLPAKAEKTAPRSVWSLSHHSAGLATRFVTDATIIRARWTLLSARLAMPHMPATGVSGLDLYVKTKTGRWRWLGIGRPNGKTSTATLVSGIPAGRREYFLYLPLYNGVTSVELGLPKGAKLAAAGPRGHTPRKPIVFYGTSITHGCCASRPGMAYPAILGRHLNRPTINLGFSGSGKMEPVMADLHAELDPAVYFLDCLPNMTSRMVTERVEPFVRTLRKAHPETPIILCEDRNYPNGFLIASRRQRNETNHVALREAFRRLTAAGVKNLHYIPADEQLGQDGEATVDGSHPTDLGFMRQVGVFEKVLAPLLKQ